MPDISITVALESDISYTLIRTDSNSKSESASLSYSVLLTHGTGDLEANYGVFSSGTGTFIVDLSGLTKYNLGQITTVEFSKIKAIIVENAETTSGMNLNIHATGSYAWTDPFNGESGNFIVKPYSTWKHFDVLEGTTVDINNREFTIQDVTGSGAAWNMIVVGVTG